MSGPRASFFAAGRPVTQGSKTIGRTRTGRVFLREDAKGLKAWRDTLTAMAARTAGRVGMITGPVRVELTFSFERPASHYGTGRNAGRVKDSATGWPDTKWAGDIDKLTRAVFDSLTAGGVIEDDARVVEASMSKAWCVPGATGGVLVNVEPARPPQ